MLIEVKNLSKFFGSFAALDGVDLSIPKGSVCGLVGPNGAGKTTLIRHLAGLYRPDGGEVKINAQNPYDNAPVRSHVLFIQDDVAPFYNWTIESMHKFYRNMYPGFDDVLFAELGDFLPKIDEKRRVSKLSRGMKKQVAFRLAIAARPNVLLLDEPVDGLDPVVRHQMWSVLMREVEGGKLTVLVSSHNLRELEDVCDRIAIMNRGKIVLSAGCDELRSKIFKLQVAFTEAVAAPPAGLEILHGKVSGNIHEYVIRGDAEQAKAALEPLRPAFIQQMPVSLEETFIYSLGGENDEIKEIL